MTDHLLAQTLPRELADIAAYYSRGMRSGTAEEQAVEILAQFIVDGDMGYADAHAALMHAHLQRTGDIDLETEERLGKRLADTAFRLEMGAEKAALAEPRRDMHPLVAKGLGIDPEMPLVDRDQINALIAGRRLDGEKIAGKIYAKLRTWPADPKTGEVVVSTPIGSYDFCPSPDKSVSVAHSFSEPAQQAMIYNAHILAARDAVAYIATQVGQASTGAGGRGEKVPGHVGWLEFTHYTSRRTQITVKDDVTGFTRDDSLPGDPDLHTHFLIPNAVFCDDGRVGSLDTNAIAGFNFEADAVYHAQIAQYLRDAGFAVEMDPETGAAVMTAVPKNVCTLFSKRTNRGEELAKLFTKSRNEDWNELSPEQRSARIKNATQGLDQKEKGGKDDVADIGAWKQQAKTVLDWEASSFQAYGPPAPEMTREQRLEIAYEASLDFIERRLEQKSVIPHWDLRAAAGYGLVRSGSLDPIRDINAVTQMMRERGVRQYGELTALVWGVDAGRRYVSVTTELHEAQEKEFIALGKKAAADHSAALPRALLDQTIRESGLDFSGEHGKAQLAMIYRLGTGSGRFGVAVAASGAGKTTALRPLVSAWKEQGRVVYGASLAWRQADDLVDAGIDQRNVKAIDVLIKAANAGDLKLDRNTVIAIDEFAMLGTAQGLALLRLRERFDCQIVALGDPLQIGAISAGNIVSLSRLALGADQIPEILTTVRQQTLREREVSGLFRDGRAREAIDMKLADGTAEMVPGGYTQTVARAAQLYAELLRSTGKAPTVTAPTNMDAHRISEAIREERRKMGLLGPDIKHVQGKENSMALAIGDRVRLFKSTGARYTHGGGGSIGRNGSVLEVLAVEKGGLVLRNAKTGREGLVAWKSLANNLGYGHAMTVNTAQGIDSPDSILATPSGSQAMNGLAAYSGGTRHRQRSYLVTSEVAERAEIKNRRPLNDGREVTADDKWANVARHLSHQPEKEIAVDVLARIEKVRRGVVRAFPSLLHVAEQQTLRGEVPSYAHEKAERLRQVPTVQRMTNYVRELHQRVQPVMQRIVARERAHERQAPTMTM